MIKKNICWPVALFLILNPLLSISLTILYCLTSEISYPIIAFAFLFSAVTNLSITAGYHRLFSHKSYDAHTFVKIIYLLIGAAAFQGSALKWSSDHRRHHRHIDTDQDPYNIKKGFWYAHIGWLFLKDSVDLTIKAADLEKDKWVKLQDKYYIPIALLMGFVFPMLIGGFFGSMLGGFAIAGGLRIFLTQQSTFLINSLCHTLGKQTFSKELSARDSWVVALLTHGEGYHSFHHKFQADYRNGIYWYQWDPTKWVIRVLKFLGLASKLRVMPSTEISLARLEVEMQELASDSKFSQNMQTIRENIINSYDTLRKLHLEYNTIKRNTLEMKDDLSHSFDMKLNELNIEIKKAKESLKNHLIQWRVYKKTA